MHQVFNNAPHQEDFMQRTYIKEIAKKVCRVNRQTSLLYDWKKITEKWIEIIDETYQRVKS